MSVAAAVNIAVYLAAAIYVFVVRGWPVKAESISVWIIGVIAGVLMILDLHLIGLHIYLNCRQISTLDLIIQRDRQKAEEKLQQKRKRRESPRGVNANSATILPLDSTPQKSQQVVAQATFDKQLNLAESPNRVDALNDATTEKNTVGRSSSSKQVFDIYVGPSDKQTQTSGKSKSRSKKKIAPTNRSSSLQQSQDAAISPDP